jgi:hypothetical protein
MLNIIKEQDNQIEEQKQKIHINEIDFDDLDIDELLAIKNEIDSLIEIHKLKKDRLVYIKKHIEEEKNNLHEEMLANIKSEKEQILKDFKKKIKAKQQLEDEDEDSIESVIYSKENPKGKVTRAKTSSKKIVNKKK